jgi:multiple sugar transport system permease protein
VKMSIFTASTQPTAVAVRHNQRQYSQWFFLAPGLFVLLVLNIFPMLYSLWVSLHRLDLADPGLNAFVGLQNYWADLHNGEFLQSLGTTLVITVATVVVQFVGGFLIALALNRTDVRGHKIVASVLIMPLAISPLVIGILWRFMLNADYGIVIWLFHSLGIHAVNPIGTPLGAFLSVVGVYSWEWMPFVALFLYAAMLGLDRSPFEAAAVDGATPTQTVLRIMLPMLRQIFVILVLLQTVTAFRMFTIVDVLTAGGPGTVTQTLSYLVWQNGLNYFTTGTATSMSWIMVIIMSIFAALLIKVLKFEV